MHRPQIDIAHARTQCPVELKPMSGINQLQNIRLNAHSVSKSMSMIPHE